MAGITFQYCHGIPETNMEKIWINLQKRLWSYNREQEAKKTWVKPGQQLVRCVQDKTIVVHRCAPCVQYYAHYMPRVQE